MSTELIIIIGIAYYVVTVILIIGALILLTKKDKNTLRKQIDDLERDKNLIISASLIAELKKVEPLIANTNMQQYFDGFPNCITMDLSYLNTSLTTDMSSMFGSVGGVILGTNNKYLVRLGRSYNLAGGNPV